MNKIRKITIGYEPMIKGMNYSVDGDANVWIDGKNIKMKISIIEEINNPDTNEFGYYVYVQNNNETQLWKYQPKNDATAIEYFID